MKQCVAVSDQRVLVDRTGLYTYSDLLIVRGPLELDPENSQTITNPTAIVEVLSPSTEKYDCGAKFRNYQQIPSLNEYILVAQDEAVIERYIRQADGSWGLVSFVGLEATLAFTIRCRSRSRWLMSTRASRSTNRRRNESLSDCCLSLRERTVLRRAKDDAQFSKSSNTRQSQPMPPDRVPIKAREHPPRPDLWLTTEC